MNVFQQHTWISYRDGEGATSTSETKPDRFAKELSME